MDVQQGLAEVNGARLYYEVAGSGHPLVLIHAYALDTRMWDSQFEEFAQRYQVVRYDVRGFGRSAPPTEESYSHVEDLKALLDLLSLPRPPSGALHGRSHLRKLRSSTPAYDDGAGRR